MMESHKTQAEDLELKKPSTHWPSQTSASSPSVLFGFQTHGSCCLLNISSWSLGISTYHCKLKLLRCSSSRHLLCVNICSLTAFPVSARILVKCQLHFFQLLRSKSLKSQPWLFSFLFFPNLFGFTFMICIFLYWPSHIVCFHSWILQSTCNIGPE